jgi:hypothetical protein
MEKNRKTQGKRTFSVSFGLGFDVLSRRSLRTLSDAPEDSLESEMQKQ